MACDEVLLAEVARTGQPVLRFYQWQRPTLSLGYFQTFADRAQHPTSQNADMVRRLSGGGAIVHDSELTYSLFLPTSHALAAETQQLYNAVHLAVIDGIDALLSSAEAPFRGSLCPQSSKSPEHEPPFLCFQRRSPGDILLRDTGQPLTSELPKIVGSAQRRRNRVVLQHGSVLLSRSPLAPELPGIAEIAGVEISAESLQCELQPRFASALSLELVPNNALAEKLRTSIVALEREKYANPQWTERR